MDTAMREFLVAFHEGVRLFPPYAFFRTPSSNEAVSFIRNTVRISSTPLHPGVVRETDVFNFVFIKAETYHEEEGWMLIDNSILNQALGGLAIFAVQEVFPKAIVKIHRASIKSKSAVFLMRIIILQDEQFIMYIERLLRTDENLASLEAFLEGIRE